MGGCCPRTGAGVWVTVRVRLGLGHEYLAPIRSHLAGAAATAHGRRLGRRVIRISVRVRVRVRVRVK